MPNVYAAIQAKMGNWQYYIVKMRMKEIRNEVEFAHDVHDDPQLSMAIQRELDQGRAKKSIVDFIARREDRFFGSIVVAALGGGPKFRPIDLNDETMDDLVGNHFGILTFQGDQKYYALDGQHRLFSINAILDPKVRLEQGLPDPPTGFEDEEISVLLVTPPRDQDRSNEPVTDDPKFLQSYRRLFSSLNRYARKTDHGTNIIMDEDDPFAIITRRLITEHDFFRWGGREKESERVKTASKNLNSSDSHVTSLETLYELNIELLATAARKNEWGGPRPKEQSLTFRPEEEYLDLLYDELGKNWDAVIKTLPDLESPPEVMRNHNPTDSGDERVDDNLLFWPIGQIAVCAVIREMLNTWDTEGESVDSAAFALKPLSVISWSLYQEPWNYFWRVPNKSESFNMRSENRKLVIECSTRMIRWIVGLDDLSNADEAALRTEWAFLLRFPLTMDPDILAAQDGVTQKQIEQATLDRADYIERGWQCALDMRVAAEKIRID
jgi:DGQHR domain-containing protein